MATPTGKRVFVSYVRDNEEQVEELCAVLAAAQIPYWRDRNEIAPGDDWKAKIRDAIRSESLIFLACFSDESVARERSTMNEELVLAVEEFRMRPPGAAWLVPVRFSDVSLPAWDLGAGKTLSDLDYASLFGPRMHLESNRLVGTLSRLYRTDESAAAAAVAATSQADPTARVDAVRRLVKQWIRDPAAQIKLDDLVTTETTAVVDRLRETGDTAFETNDVGHLEQVAIAAKALAEETLPLCAALQIACRWASEEDVNPWVTSLRRVTQAAAEVKGGYDAFLGLREIPGLLLLLTTALATAGQDRWDLLRALVVDNRARQPHAGRGQVPVVDTQFQWKAFRNVEPVAQILARAADGTRSLHDCAELIAANHVGMLFTPVSDWTHEILKPVFADQFPDEGDYDDAFDRAETMLALLSVDARRQEFGPDASAWRRSTGWYGRATWRVNYGADPLGDIERELSAAGDRWHPLTAGLFGGDIDRARAALADYVPAFQKVARERY